MNFAVIVPARLESQRLPGKPLALVAGKPMLLHVLGQAAKSGADRVIAATDSDEIAKVARDAGFETHQTGKCESGSERAAVTASDLGLDQVVVNLQCDEPETDPKLISRLARRAAVGDCDCATAAATISEAEATSQDVVKVVKDKASNALYFSRAKIPARRNDTDNPPIYLGHVGIYAFAQGRVKEIANMERSELEQSERLEQLSWLWHGWQIAIEDAGHFTHGIDTQEDLDAASARLAGS